MLGSFFFFRATEPNSGCEGLSHTSCFRHKESVWKIEVNTREASYCTGLKLQRTLLAM